MHIHWDEVLPHITFAYNCSKQDPTRCSPFQLIYVRNPTLPIDVALRAVVNEEPRKPKTDFAESVLATDYRSSEAGTNGPATGQWEATTNTPVTEETLVNCSLSDPVHFGPASHTSIGKRHHQAGWCLLPTNRAGGHGRFRLDSRNESQL